MKAVMKKSNEVKVTSGKVKKAVLPKRQETALAALLSCPTIKEASEACGISEVTLWRYLRDAKFLSRYRAAQREVVQHAVMRLQHDTSEAAKVLCEIAKDTNAPASSRVAASRTILDQAIRSIELGEMQERVDKLEERIKTILEEKMLDDAVKEAKNE